MKNNFLQFKKVWLLTPPIQIFLILLFFIVNIFITNILFKKTGTVFNYPVSQHFVIIFAPFYEEIIFRGIVFAIFLKKFEIKKAIIFTSIIFALWHLKNIFFLDPLIIAKQILYAGLIFSPVMCYVTYKFKTIWIGVILHYINNLIIFSFCL